MSLEGTRTAQRVAKLPQHHLDRGWASEIHSIEVPAGSKDLRLPFWIGNGGGDRAEREVEEGVGMGANVMRRLEAKYIH